MIDAIIVFIISVIVFFAILWVQAIPVYIAMWIVGIKERTMLDAILITAIVDLINTVVKAIGKAL